MTKRFIPLFLILLILPLFLGGITKIATSKRTAAQNFSVKTSGRDDESITKPTPAPPAGISSTPSSETVSDTNESKKDATESARLLLVDIRNSAALGFSVPVSDQMFWFTRGVKTDVSSYTIQTLSQDEGPVLQFLGNGGFSPVSDDNTWNTETQMQIGWQSDSTVCLVFKDFTSPERTLLKVTCGVLE